MVVVVVVGVVVVIILAPHFGMALAEWLSSLHEKSFAL